MLNPALKIAALFLLLFVSVSIRAQKTDKVFLKNGDVLTGEVESLKFAQLNFNMTSTGTVQIKWLKIAKIVSDKIFEVTTLNGDVLVTQLDSAFFESMHISLNDIVEIVQIKDKFIKRLSGNVDLGFNYTKSSDIVQFNFNSSLTYRKPKKESDLYLSSIISNKTGDSTISKNQNATLSHIRALRNSLYLTSTLGWQQNTELGIASRFLLTAAGGKIFLNDNHQRFLTGSGLSYNVEESDETNMYSSSLEALLTVQYKRFVYLTPKVSIDAKYTIYAGLTDWGRIRMDMNMSGKYEILKDFNVGLTFYYNYDSRPPTGALSTYDYGVNFTLGYEFGK